MRKSRWLFFIFIGYPIQLLVMFLYPIAVLLFWIFIHRRKELKDHNLYRIPERREHSLTRDDGIFLANTDDHNAFTHVYYWMHHTQYWSKGHWRLQLAGSIIRRFINDRREDHRVSGDCVVFYAWSFAMKDALYGTDVFDRRMINEIAWKYLINLGMPSSLDNGSYGVSTRCSNFGVNLASDGWKGLSQPCFGPQFYTSQSLFSLAARLCGGKWHVIKWLHWLLMGGWLWRWEPVLYTNKDKLGYVRDVTMKALHVMMLNGSREAVRPMRRICYGIAEVKNPLFMAMLGELDSKTYMSLPDIINPWFSQTVGCENGDEPSTNAFVKRSLLFIDNLSARCLYR